MGLLDTLLGRESTETATEGEGSLMNGVLHMLSSGQGGGLQGIVQSFESQGLGHIVSSWIGTGSNKPISPDQVEQGLGSERVSQIADHSGMSVEETKHGLAQMLPTLIDKLTPNGQIPEGGMLEKAISFLKTRAGT